MKLKLALCTRWTVGIPGEADAAATLPEIVPSTGVSSVSEPEPAIASTPVNARPATVPESVPSSVHVVGVLGPVSVLSTVGSRFSCCRSVALIGSKSSAELVPVRVVPFHVQELSPVSDGIDSVALPPDGPLKPIGTGIEPPPMSIVRFVPSVSAPIDGEDARQT